MLGAVGYISIPGALNLKDLTKSKRQYIGEK